VARSFILASSPLVGSGETPRRVAVTGAAGRIGQSFCAYARDRYALRVAVHRASQRVQGRQYGEVIVGDLCDRRVANRVVDGIDTVVHLAANPSPHAEWGSLHRDNIMATYTVFAAAADAGCRRVVFASSIHAVSGYPGGYQVHTDDPVNPGDLYGVSKCFGEALARYMAVQKGLSAIVLRIGAFQPRESAVHADSVAMMSSFVSHRDLDQLICRCIDDAQLLFAVFHALSDNVFNRMDTGDAEGLVGYSPEDDFAELNRRLANLPLRDSIRPHNARHRHSPDT
jgi:hypothetical protein